jgi:hypothetical protein
MSEQLKVASMFTHPNLLTIINSLALVSISITSVATPSFANSQHSAFESPNQKSLSRQIEDFSSQTISKSYFEVMYNVPLIPQQTRMSCWAAGAAMLVSWRDQVSINFPDIVKANGYWHQYFNGLRADDRGIFPIFDMVDQPAQTYTVLDFKRLLEIYGPLWVATSENSPHIRVITGIRGDGTPDGTILYINDPWEKGMQRFRPSNKGAKYTETYREFIRQQETLAHQEKNVQGIYVAHLKNKHR